MAIWRFLDYFPEEGGCPIREWYTVQDVEVQAALDAVIGFLRNTEDWLDPRIKEFKMLEHPHDGLGEIRFGLPRIRMAHAHRTVKRLFRPAGILIPKKHEFILLVGCEKTGRIYNPPNTFDLALRLKRRFDQGFGATDDHI